MAKAKILFIDDDSFLRKVYQTELQDKGFEVQLAVDGEEGLQQIAAMKPNLVILDLIMPKKSGFDVLADMQRDPELRKIPVIVLSNLAQSDDQKRALDLGASDYLVKDNTTLDSIIGKIEYYLHVGATSRPAAPPPKSAPQPVKTAEPKSDVKPRTPEAEPTTASQSVSAAGVQRNFCSQCGFKIKKTDKFCPNCGAKL